MNSTGRPSKSDELRASLIESLIEGASISEFRKGQRVALETGVRAAVPLVIEGSLRIAQPMPDGAALTLYRVRSKQLCAASALGALSGQTWTVSAAAERDSRVALVPPARVRELFETEPCLRDHLLLRIAERVDAMLRLAVRNRRVSLDERVADLLLQFGPEVRASHQELADRLGCSRESISRTLAAFEGAGLVRRGYTRVDVLDPDRLQRRLRGTDNKTDDKNP